MPSPPSKQSLNLGHKELKARQRADRAAGVKYSDSATLRVHRARSLLGHLVWKEFSGSIRVLLDNPYVFADFWQHHNGKLTAAEWKDRFRASRRAAERALADNDTLKVLAIVFSRLYVLRNQLIHGGATWASQANRAQVRDCANFMGKVVPAIIEIMMDHPPQDWGKVVYPVVANGVGV